MKNRDAAALIAKIGLQTERVSRKREAADVEAQKVSLSAYHSSRGYTDHPPCSHLKISLAITIATIRYDDMTI